MIRALFDRLDDSLGIPALPPLGTLHTARGEHVPRAERPKRPDPAPVPAERFGGVDELKRQLAKLKTDVEEVEKLLADEPEPRARTWETIGTVLDRMSGTCRTAAQRARHGARHAHVHLDKLSKLPAPTGPV